MKASFFDLERLFDPIASAVERFASQAGFNLHKCARGNSGWELTKELDEGGTVFLLLMYDEESGLGIGSVWQFPCEEMSRLYTHFRPMRPAQMESAAVLSMLQEEKDAILAVKFGYWTHITGLQAQDSRND